MLEVLVCSLQCDTIYLKLILIAHQYYHSIFLLILYETDPVISQINDGLTSYFVLDKQDLHIK